MINETFSGEKVGEFYNQHFINYKLDMEKGEGPVLKATYNVSSYPSLFYLTPDGKVLHSLKGYQPSLDFIE